MPENKIQNSIILGALFHNLEKVFGKGYFENNSEFFGALENVCDVKKMRNILLREKDDEYFQMVSRASEFQSGKKIEEEFENLVEISDEKKLASLFPFISVKKDIEKNEIYKDKKKSGDFPLNKLVYSNFEGCKLFIREGENYKEYKNKFKDDFEELLKTIESKNSELSFDAVFSFFCFNSPEIRLVPAGEYRR